MPTGLDIDITVGGSSIPRDSEGHTGVLYAPTKFHSESNAIPGTCEVYVKDRLRELSFNTGDEIVCTVDGTAIWGGYLTQISRQHFFADKVEPLWVLHGVDYNVVFDKRVIRNTDDYLSVIDNLDGDVMDGEALRMLLSTYSDMGGFSDAGIDDIVCVSPRADPDDDCDPDEKYAWPQQGERIRVAFEDFARFAGAATYWIGGDKVVNYKAVETLVSDWGFSDAPDDVSTFGFRDVDAVEDGSVIVNDALVWGGSELAGVGGTTFYRQQDSTSISDHGRWQVAEVHVGEAGYGGPGNAGPKSRARSIVLGPPGIGFGVGGIGSPEEQKGLRYAQWEIDASWFHHRVPGFLTPGVIVPINLSIFGEDRSLPLRSLDISFPTLDKDGKTYVQYRGAFSLQTTDPFSLWAMLMRVQFRKVKPLLGAANDDSTGTVFGAYGNFSPTHVTGLVYKIPFGYVNGTLLIYDHGRLLTPDTDFEETDAIKGRFTLNVTPEGPLFAVCRTLSS